MSYARNLAVFKGFTVRHILLIALLLGGPLMAAAPPRAQFTENRGQWPEQVLYRALVPGGALFVERSAFTVVLFTGLPTHGHGPEEDHSHDDVVKGHAYRVHFEGGRSQANIGLNEQGHYQNFFLGADETGWGTGCRVFGGALLKNVWPGVDIRLNGTDGIKYDLVVAPGTDPDVIRMRYEGQDKLALNEGELHVTTSTGVIVEEAPVSWYRFFDGIDNHHLRARSSYRLRGNLLSFDVAAKDDLELVIDPTLSFASYTGSTADNFGFTATYDALGHLYGAGIVFDPGYPTTTGVFQDAFQGGDTDIGISKWSADGSTLIWSTYLGGTQSETPHSLVVNDAEELFVLGATGSSDLPITPGAFDATFNGGGAINLISGGWAGLSGGYGFSHPSGSDILLAHFNASATALIGCTYVGGTGNDGLNNTIILANNYGDHFRGEIVLNLAGEPVISTSTTSSDAPVTAGAPQGTFGGIQDAYFFRMDPALTTMLWGTYHGGQQRESGFGVQTDSNGELFFSGGTTSGDMPTAGTPLLGTTQGAADGYVARYNAAGNTLLGSTFLGTGSYDQCYFVQLDSDDEVYVIGQTSGDYPITPGIYANPGSSLFIQKLSHDLSTSLWSTRIGNSSSVNISPTAFLVSDCDQIYFSGWGGLLGQAMTGMPVTPDAFQSGTDGSDFYLMVLEPEATGLNYATYFGGSSSNEHVDGGTSRFDKNGTVYQAVCAGCGSNDDFPTTPGAWSNTNGSTNCNLGVFKFSLGQPVAIIGIDGPSTICEGSSAQFTNSSFGGTDYLWDFGDGSATVTDEEPSHDFDGPGTYQVTMILSDPDACITSDTATVTVTVLPPPTAVAEPVEPLCPGGSGQLQASGGDGYSWFPATGLSATNIPDPLVTTDTSGTWSVVVSTACGTDTAEVAITLLTVTAFAQGDTTICLGQAAQLSATGGSSYLWSPAGNLSGNTTATPTATPDTTTVYAVTITTAENCIVQDSVAVNVLLEIPEPSLSDTIICRGDTVVLSTGVALNYQWEDLPGIDQLDVRAPSFHPLVPTLYTVAMSNSCGTVLDSVFVDVIVVEALAWRDTLVCPGIPVPLLASGSQFYAWTPVTGLSDPTVADPIAMPAESTTYQVLVSDTAGCSDTASVTVQLRPLPVVEAGPDVVTDFGQWVSLLATGTGTLEWTPPLWLDDPQSESPRSRPEESITYTVTVTDSDGCKNSDVLTIILNGELFVPNTFTPNGDGYNDLFGALGKDIATFRMLVFNRWGEQIWSTDQLAGRWDGNCNGVASPIDTYVWKMEAVEISGRQRSAIGHVNLVR